MPTTEPVHPESPAQEIPQQTEKQNDTPDTLDAMLARPLDQRIREYKYRFAQAVVFGLPVVALQLFGDRLGGPESGKWVALFQAILAGWVMYVGAAGMLFEGILLLRRRITFDFVVAVLAIGLYLASIPTVVYCLTLAAHSGPRHAVWFHLSVVLIGVTLLLAEGVHIMEDELGVKRVYTEIAKQGVGLTTAVAHGWCQPV